MIVEFDRKYIDDLIQVYIETFIGDPWNETWEHDWVLERIEWLASLPNFKGYIKLQNNKVIASILGYSKPFKGRSSFEIVELFVRPECQGIGIGKELVSVLEEALKEDGASMVTLLTSSNTESKVFYKKLGYVAKPQLCFMISELYYRGQIKEYHTKNIAYNC